MSRVFKILKSILLIGSFVFFGIALVIGGITLNPDSLIVSNYLVVYIVGTFSFVGVFLMYSTNDIAKKIGTGLAVELMLMSFFVGIMYLESGITAIFCLIASIIFILYWVVVLIGHLAIKEAPLLEDNDELIAKLNKWHELLEKEIITKEEFQLKRDKILGLNQQNKK